MKNVITIAFFLLPPSCMVVPIGNLANKSHFSLTNTNFLNTDLNTKHFIPTMSSTNDIGMDIPMGQVPSNKSEVREKIFLSCKSFQRVFSGFVWTLDALS